ncbi:MAG: Diadenylate cyclase [Syntrophus sp. SKADARSKE-3]|nr:Diadenylate cyclase [Syntrophus sp. SKADARSKE-3]
MVTKYSSVATDAEMIKDSTCYLLAGILTADRLVNLDTLAKVILLALEIAREEREGRKIGTIFVVSDSDRVLQDSRCMILDPLIGHSEESLNIDDHNLRETVKELAQLDGAFIVSDQGKFLSACRYLNATSKNVALPMGLGSRHMAAASITRETDAVAVVVSESSIVRVFDNGEIISEIIPEIWLLSRYSLHMEGHYSERSGDHLTVVSKDT